jgi:ParB family chromosome partitioning protein
VSDTERKGRRFTLPSNRLNDLKDHAERKVLESHHSPDVTTEIALDKLVPASWNARRYFDPDAIEALGSDIKEKGQIHPILVRPNGPDFEVVVGERRYRAALSVGLRSLRAYVRDLNDTDAQRISLSENLEREDLNAYEETLGYLQLITLELENVEQFRAFCKAEENKEEAARRLLYSLYGKRQRRVNNVINAEGVEPLLTLVEGVFSSSRNMTWQSFVQNRLPILDLPEEILLALRKGKIEYTKAVTLAKVKNDSVRNELLTRVMEEDLSLVQLKAEIKALAAEVTSTGSSIAERASAVARVLRKRRAIKDVKVQKRVEKLLFELEKLLADY